MRIKGRVWFALWIVFAVAVAALVIARNTSGYVSARELDEIRNRRSVLQARKNDLVVRVRRAESHSVLVSRAEAMGLRLPADSEIVILQIPGYEER